MIVCRLERDLVENKDWTASHTPGGSFSTTGSPPCTSVEVKDLVRLGDCIDKMSSDESDSILNPAVLAQPPTNKTLGLSRLASSHVCRNFG